MYGLANESQMRSESVPSATVPTGTEKEKLTQERLKELLRYDPETGEFWWRVDRRSIKPGELAGSATGQRYRAIGVSGKDYLAHRLAWFYVHGYFPENEIDHINRVRDDNRLANLREVTHTCNMRNSPGVAGSPSGVKGITKIGSKWRANIGVDGKSINLGTFFTKSAAAKARLEAESKYNYSVCDKGSEAESFISNHTSDITEEEARVKHKLELRSRGKSGVVGVNHYKDTGKWVSTVRAYGSTIHLGIYETKLEAAKVRHAAEVKYKYPNCFTTSSAKKFIEEQENG